MNHVDVLVLGAGGAGLMCAIESGKRGRKTLVLDHSAKIGGKILISGGGRCNFTNLGASAKNYVSLNPHFCKSAMSRYTPQDFLTLVEKHKIPYHEKKLGQQFCDGSAQAIVTLLEAECREARAEIRLGVKIESCLKTGPKFVVTANDEEWQCESLVVATGGLSLPKIGATDFGHRLAKKFGHSVTILAPALDGFVLSELDSERFGGLAGVATETTMTVNGISFRENILFTHAGLSGPASLQASLHWYSGDTITIDFCPKTNLQDVLIDLKRTGARLFIPTILSEYLPRRLVDRLCELFLKSDLPITQISDEKILMLCEAIHALKIIPKSTVGYSKAEVTRGGVNTDEISSKTMESKLVPGLYFIGEVVDVTGWLGGYNFQWAWASGWAAGQVV